KSGNQGLVMGVKQLKRQVGDLNQRVSQLEEKHIGCNGGVEPPVEADGSFPVVQSWDQIEANLRRFVEYLRSSDAREQEFAKSLLKRAICIVSSTRGGQELFGPSRFVGYAGNTLKKHQDNLYKDGKETNAAISGVLGQSPAKSQSLDARYQDFCR